MQLDFEALFEDVMLARAELFRKHCLHADDITIASLGLATALCSQLKIIIRKVSENNPDKRSEYIKLYQDMLE